MNDIILYVLIWFSSGILFFNLFWFLDFGELNKDFCTQFCGAYLGPVALFRGLCIHGERIYNRFTK